VGVYVSVSHSGPYAVCAIADVPVGVDVEVVRSADEKFMRRVCSEAEMAYIRVGDDGDCARFWETWTAKEALFKLTGKGPLLALSRLALPRGVVLDHVMQKGCALTTALRLG
jgi:4'-phosphopantetheinyl transferase